MGRERWIVLEENRTGKMGKGWVERVRDLTSERGEKWECGGRTEGVDGASLGKMGRDSEVRRQTEGMGRHWEN